MAFERDLTVFMAIQIFGFIKHRTVLHENCTEQNDMQKGKICRLSHSTGCMIEYEEVLALK